LEDFLLKGLWFQWFSLFITTPFNDRINEGFNLISFNRKIMFFAAYDQP